MAAEDSKSWNEIQTDGTNVCSLHFRESEIKNGLGGRKMRVDIHGRIIHRIINKVYE